MATERILPMLVSKSSGIPKGTGWYFQLKLNGHRTLAHIDRGRARLLTKKGLEQGRSRQKACKLITQQLPQVIKARQCVLDGELIARRPDSTYQHPHLFGKPGVRLEYYMFDLLRINGKSIMDEPIEYRQAKLQEIYQEAEEEDKLAKRRKAQRGQAAAKDPQEERYVLLLPLVTDAQALWQFVQDHRLEGMVAKRKGSQYVSGKRSRSWLKIKPPTMKKRR